MNGPTSSGSSQGMKRPVEAGIDPYNKLVDRNSDDNVIATLSP